MTDELHLHALATELIESQSTMALATAGNGEAWAAPVYYVFYKGGFYFFSAPDSRHIMESMENAQASATIYPFVSSWKEIRGIQMSGSIEAVSVSLEAIAAVRAYLKKFPFTGDFFSSHEDLDLAAFAKRFNVKLYRFKPNLIFYVDNGIRFGFRESITI